MEANKMREQFEARFVEEYVRVLGEGARELAAHTLAANPPLVSMSWWAWQASREAVLVTLPKITGHEYDPLAGADYREGCREAIEAQGLKVAP
ncbi:hypothetical protein NPS34_25810 [Pseudomonas putida]|uniref:Uncharacterized protein n=1 Tax=Pseudomonas putida (strain ATCC 700007 / DSM 6899 / JCM 31910 / BCRC 17059 / LMG 24140 / F1) TaxID=351746 RepID=A5W5V7_PSEP1|nr:hypothetical protein [Pseudomonas putida]MDD2001451.1 hypothetical protein [Pseudomonas putida]HDS1791446.1 hypothetical protein [Pseudomonas putida]